MKPARLLALLSLSVLPACAAAPGTVAPRPTDAATTASSTGATELSVNPNGEITGRVRNEVSATVFVIPASADRTWGVLEQAYRDMGITVEARNPAAHTLGNANVHPRGGIGGRRVSEYLDCGNTNLGAPAADLYSVRMSVQSHVVAQGDSSRVETEVTAFARDMNGSASTPVHCNSRGRLESALNFALLQLLPAGGGL